MNVRTGETVGQLHVRRGMPAPQVIQILQASSVLGRSEDADICIPNPHVSRRHARITMSSGQVCIEDLGSKNGTAVDGKAVSMGLVPLRHGSEIDMARGRVVLSFSDSQSTLDAPGSTERIEPRTFAGGFRVDAKRRTVETARKTMHNGLAANDFEILSFLWRNFGQLCHTDDLKRAGWPDDEPKHISDNALRTRISRIRNWMGQIPGVEAKLLSVRSLGYSLSSDNGRDIPGSA